MSSPVNSGVSVANVPLPAGTTFLPASAPASARIGITSKKRPSHMVAPSIVL